ncbi:potassium-transporting ATPase subunit KdpC [Paraburkholderia jirisanensis]
MSTVTQTPTPSQANQPGVPLFRGMARPALVSAVFFMVVTGLAYPLATTGVAQLVWPAASRGSLVERGGAPAGSLLIGQNFTRPQYFHPRPSATLGPDPAHPDQSVAQPYNAAASGASNLGTTSKSLVDQVQARAVAYRSENGLAADAPVPVDAVTASASGLDPDISVANAVLQGAHVAHARGLTPQQVNALIEQNVTPRQLGVLGDPRVNVLKLNLALDAVNATR